jgi:flavin reductase (DIM6/NTAB) family NADH-FMN oxidoreductase RutF
MSEPMNHDETHAAIGAVLGRTPSGLFVVSAASAAGDETAMLASWVQQASFSPPMLTVALNRSRRLNDWLAETPRVALSLLGESQRGLLKHFAAGFAPGEPAFEGVPLVRGTTGLPMLAEALGYLEGEVENRLNCGDHTVHLVRITGGGLNASMAQEKPWVHLRKSGFHY